MTYYAIFIYLSLFKLFFFVTDIYLEFKKKFNAIYILEEKKY